MFGTGCFGRLRFDTLGFFGGGDLVFVVAGFDSAANQRAQINTMVWAEAAYSSDFGMTAIQARNVPAELAVVNAFSGQWFLGQNIQVQLPLVNALQGSLRLGINHQMRPVHFATVVDAQATTMSSVISYIIMDGEIPPGGTLVIDSDSYTALLDHVNVIDRHSGTWLLLDRNVHDVVVEAVGDTSALETLILYQERWI